MKTNSIFSKISLAVLIAGTIAACTNKPAATTAAPATPPAADKNPIVYVNSDTLLSNYTYAKEMRKRVEDKQKSEAGSVQSRGQAWQREVAEYQKSQPTMSADDRQKTEARLGREQQELQTFQQNATAEYQNFAADESKKQFDKIADYLKAYAKEKGYKMVLTYSKGNSAILYGDASLDITTDVVKGLNDAYAKEKK